MPFHSTVELFSHGLKKLYGEHVEMVFIDIFSEEGRSRYPGIWEQVYNRTLHVPVITVDLEVAVHGIISLAPVQEKLSPGK